MKKIDSGEPLKNNELANVNDLVEVLKTSHELSLLPINIIPTTSSTNSSSTDGESYVYKKFSKEQIQANWLQFLTKVWLFLENIFRQRLLSNPRERAMVQRELSEIILEVIFLELNVSGKILLQKDDPTSTKDVQITMSTTGKCHMCSIIFQSILLPTYRYIHKFNQSIEENRSRHYNTKSWDETTEAIHIPTSIQHKRLSKGYSTRNSFFPRQG